jgi:hypothetical protein
MNKSEKLICINDNKTDDILFSNNFTLIKGNIYCYNTRTIGDDIISLEEDNNKDVGFFPHGGSKGGMEYYFITLADWRAKQIDSILNDEMKTIKLVCINNKNNPSLELNKVYDGIIIDGVSRIINGNDVSIYFTNRFITLAEWRDKQIDKILEND